MLFLCFLLDRAQTIDASRGGKYDTSGSIYPQQPPKVDLIETLLPIIIIHFSSQNGCDHPFYQFILQSLQSYFRTTVTECANMTYRYCDECIGVTLDILSVLKLLPLFFLRRGRCH